MNDAAAEEDRDFHRRLLDALHVAFGVVGHLPRFRRTTLGVLPIKEAHGLRMFVLIDPDGNLLRCLDNLYQAA